MRKVVGVLFMLVAVGFVYWFTAWGTLHSANEGNPWWPFKSLGRNYPNDVAFLAAAAWAIGIGLFFILTEPAKELAVTGRSALRFATPTGWSPMGRSFFLNACALVTVLFGAYIGAKMNEPGPLVSIFFAVAALQVAFGLILLILALFEKPRSGAALILGSAVYLAGTAVAVLTIVLGQPK